jgi:hypothetical protein
LYYLKTKLRRKRTMTKYTICGIAIVLAVLLTPAFAANKFYVVHDTRVQTH